MARARSSPLTISCSRRAWLKWKDLDMCPVLLDALINHRDSLRAVDISQFSISSPTDASIIKSKLQSFFTGAAPQLCSLELESESDNEGESDRYGVEIELPSSLFDGHFPKLRHITLSPVRGNWLTISFHGLATLSIGQVEPLTSFNLLLDLLDRNPALEYLSLRNVLPKQGLPGPRDRRIHLSHLRQIVLDNSDDVSCGLLLSILEATPDVLLTIDMLTITGDALHALSSSLARHILRCDVPLDCIEISYQGSYFGIRAWRKRDGQLIECALELYSEFAGYFADLGMGPAILQSTFDLLPLCDIHTAVIIGCVGGPIVTSLWRDYLPRLRKVQDFTFDEAEAIPLFALPADNASSQDGGPLLFPSLHTVQFEMSYPERELWSNNIEKDLQSKFLSALTTRKALGFPVQRLHLRSSTAKGSLRVLIPVVTQSHHCKYNSKRFPACNLGLWTDARGVHP